MPVTRVPAVLRQGPDKIAWMRAMPLFGMSRFGRFPSAWRILGAASGKAHIQAGGLSCYAAGRRVPNPICFASDERFSA